MTHMFYNSAATSLDLSGWDTSRVMDMHDMFSKKAVFSGIPGGSAYQVWEETPSG